MPKVNDLKVAAATWTNLATFLTSLGNPKHFTIIPSGTDFQLGRKATAPTAGVALVKNEAAEVIVKAGDTLVPWIFSTTGGEITVMPIVNATVVSLDGTGTT